MLTEESTNVEILSNAVPVTTECSELEITAVKKEYNIVGDGVYVSTSGNGAPQWLYDIVEDSTLAAVTSITNDRLDGITTALGNLENAILSGETSVNNRFGVIETGLESIAYDYTTLESYYEDNKSNIINLNTTKVDADTATALALTALHSEVQDNTTVLGSRLFNIDNTITTKTNSLGQQITGVVSTLNDETIGLLANSSATENLYSYVGVDKDLDPTGTGLLATINIIEKQNDGVIDTYAGTHYIKVCDLNLVDGDSNELLLNQYPYVLWTPMSGATIPTATTRIVYRDAVSSYEPILTYTVYTNTTTNLRYMYSATTSTWSEITENEYNNYEETLRSAHVGDVYILYAIEDGTKVYKESCKFVKTAIDTTSPYATDTKGYAWLRITDTDAQNAYMQALNAYDLADNKRRVFVSTPFLPYDEGDLWIDSSGTYKVIKSFNGSNWIVADEQTTKFVNETYTPTITTLQNQVDGKIEYYFYSTYSDAYSATSESDALDKIILNKWNTQELKEAANGNVVYFKDTTHGYWYSSSLNNWLTITDTSVYQALKIASTAQSTADGKVNNYYAWWHYNNTAPSTSSYKYWLKTDNILYYYNGTAWVSTVSNPDFSLGTGDLATVHKTLSDGTIDDYSYYYNGTTWTQLTTTGIVASASAVTKLSTELTNGTNTWANADSALSSTLNTTINTKAVNVESKFGYDSTLVVNGVAYNSGFGIVSSGTAAVGSYTNPTNGTNYPLWNSEFWIKADRFKLSDSYGSVPVFTIDTPSRSAVFNGKVLFNGSPSTLESAVQNYVEQVAVGDKNINITDNLIPTTSLLADVSNAGYQFIGNPVKSSAAGIDSYNEPQIVLDSDDEVYSPYVDEVSAAYYYRFGFKTSSTNINNFKICVISTSNTVTYITPNITDMVGSPLALTSNTWYIIDGIINPYGGDSTTYSGSIRSASGSQIGKVQNYAIPTATSKILLGWQTSCTISRMKLSKITADTFIGTMATQDYVDANAFTNTTVIDGGQITTGTIDAQRIAALSITADKINTAGLIADNISGLNIYGKTITGGRIEGATITGAVIKTSWLDLTSTGYLTDWKYFSPGNPPPSQYIANFAKNATTGSLIIDNDGYYRLPKTKTAVYSGQAVSYVKRSYGTLYIPNYNFDVISYDDYTIASENRVLRARPRFAIQAGAGEHLILKVTHTFDRHHNYVTMQVGSNTLRLTCDAEGYFNRFTLTYNGSTIINTQYDTIDYTITIMGLQFRIKYHTLLTPESLIYLNGYEIYLLTFYDPATGQNGLIEFNENFTTSSILMFKDMQISSGHDKEVSNLNIYPPTFIEVYSN